MPRLDFWHASSFQCAHKSLGIKRNGGYRVNRKIGIIFKKICVVWNLKLEIVVLKEKGAIFYVRKMCFSETLIGYSRALCGAE
jgi:hypothetical protein